MQINNRDSIQRIHNKNKAKTHSAGVMISHAKFAALSHNRKETKASERPAKVLPFLLRYSSSCVSLLLRLFSCRASFFRLLHFFPFTVSSLRRYLIRLTHARAVPIIAYRFDVSATNWRNNLHFAMCVVPWVGGGKFLFGVGLFCQLDWKIFHGTVRVWVDSVRSRNWLWWWFVSWSV